MVVPKFTYRTENLRSKETREDEEETSSKSFSVMDVGDNRNKRLKQNENEPINETKSKGRKSNDFLARGD